MEGGQGFGCRQDGLFHRLLSSRSKISSRNQNMLESIDRNSEILLAGQILNKYLSFCLLWSRRSKIRPRNKDFPDSYHRSINFGKFSTMFPWFPNTFPFSSHELHILRFENEKILWWKMIRLRRKKELILWHHTIYYIYLLYYFTHRKCIPLHSPFEPKEAVFFQDNHINSLR